MLIRKNIKKYLGTVLCCCLLGLGVVGTAFSSPLNPHSVVPERGVVLLGQKAPEWKVIWDDARGLAKSGNYLQAVELYQSLLLLKNDLQQARWELASLLMHVRKWDDAAPTLELLIEADPHRVEYLNSLGRVMWETGRFDRAVDLFRRAYERRPADQAALTGLVDGLMKLDRKEESLPLLDQLSRLDPGSLGVRRRLAFLAFDLKNYRMAQAILAELAENKDADQEVLRRSAQANERLGLPALAMPYWQKIVDRNPAHAEANGRLADFFEREGRLPEALPYLLVLLKADPSDADLLFRLGRIYEKQGERPLALTYYERYLERHPADHEVLRSVIKIQASLGNREKTLAALEYYFAVGDNTDPADLKMAARLYDASGRYSKAIPLYRQLIDLSPDDSEVLAALANDLLAIGENEGALSIWRHLADVTPGQLSIYRSMVDLLARLDRNDELLEILEIINRLDPADDKVTLRLAGLYRQRGQIAMALPLYEKLTTAGEIDRIELLKGRGLLYMDLQRPAQALADFEDLLDLEPEHNDIRLHCVRLAGSMGLLSVAKHHADFLSGSSSGIEKIEGLSVADNIDLRFVMADVLVASGFWQSGLHEYRQITAWARQNKKEGASAGLLDLSIIEVRARLGMSEAYLTAGLEYEAEQVLRVGLVEGDQAERYGHALFDLALSRRRTGEGAVWLNDLTDDHRASDDGIKRNPPEWSRRLMEIRLAAAGGDFEDAIRRCRRLFVEVPASSTMAGTLSSEMFPVADRPPRLMVGVVLCRLYLDKGRLAEATEVAVGLRQQGWDDIELLVLLAQVYQRGGEYPSAEEAYRLLAGIAGNENSDLGLLLRLAELYEKYSDIAAMQEVSQAAYQRNPDSLRALFLLATARERSGQLDGAMRLYSSVVRQYPDNSRAAFEMTRLMFRAGQFDAALGRCEELLALEPDRYEIVLLRARTLWALNRWNEAIAVYDQMSVEPVREHLMARLESDGAGLQLIPEKTIWDRVTFSRGTPPDLLKVLMSPVFVVGGYPADQQVKEISASLFARFRWEQRFRREAAARRSVQRREYNQAAAQYEELLTAYGADESLLFDLAGIYSRLGSLGKETILYDQLQHLNPQFPGLVEATRRNMMKRRPQLSLGYGWSEDDGWEGYRAIRNEWQEGNLWFSPEPGREFSVKASRLKYRATDLNNTVWAKRATVTYQTMLAEGMLASFSGGLETLDSDSISTAVFDCFLQGSVGDRVKGRLGYVRDATKDTVASLTRNIVKQDFTANLTVDFLPRITLEGDFGFTDFSDGNHRSDYGFSSGYILLFPPTYLRIVYSYDYENSRLEAKPGPPLADGFAADDHPYWSPGDYWLNRFTLFFKHNLSDDTLDRGVPTYYTLEYSMGYDSRDYDLQAFKAGFFWEWTEHFIVRATADFLSMKSYQGKEVFLAGIYRW